MTAPAQVACDDVLRVWREADGIPQIEHAWLVDHLMPLGGDPNGPTFEGWTLLSALAARTGRLRLGVMVTSNRCRPPALLAKITATVDVVSGGRLEFGIGVGSRPDAPHARRECAAHGLPFHDGTHAVESLAEACTIIRRPWTETAPFDFHALDRLCDEIGRNPAGITRSIVLPVSYDRPQDTRNTIRAALDRGFSHIVLGLHAPCPTAVARWAADTIIAPLSGKITAP
ncbi:LLM class flavin-dependent oxidoreductase [Streptomyces sp. 900105755]|uniref:LLM class flavin-dependent oxidoreductase n=1 Tax=Streptomyces sp. 900105755 TaxID=3154389 RepID=UPI003329A6BF